MGLTNDELDQLTLEEFFEMADAWWPERGGAAAQSATQADIDWLLG